MKNPIITRLGKSLAGASLAALAIMVISSCGGGDGDDAASRNVIAPESLDEVKINFFDAFTIECYRLSGTAGNEEGAGSYVRLKEDFNYQSAEGVSEPIDLPISLRNLQYKYQRTGVDTGRVIFGYASTAGWGAIGTTGESVPSNNMFGGAAELIVDILFTESGRVIANSVTARIRYLYNPAPQEFDSKDVKFSTVDGLPLPSGYNPYTTLNANTPNSVVMTSLDLKTFDFLVPSEVKIAFEKGGDLGPEIPGDVRAEESGTILVTESPTQVVGYNGTYSYARTGGVIAKLAVEYQRTAGGASTTVKEIFTLTFLSFDSGTYTTSTGGSGNFQNNLFTPL